MPDTGQFALFLAAALLLALAPGPGVFYVAARTLSGGRAEGIASSVGTGLGGLVHVAAGTLGVSALVLASAELFTAVKLLGAAYLIWLGIRTVLGARRDDLRPVVARSAAGTRRAFREGVMVEMLNPKTAAFFLAFIPQFVDLAGSVPAQFAVLGSMSVLLNTLVDVGVACAAAAVRTGMLGRPRMMRRMREASGVVMIGLGAGLLLVRRPAG